MGRTASTRDYLADAGRGVKLEEQTTEDSTVLKYKSSDGSNRYVATSDSAEGGGGGADTPLVVWCIYKSEWQVNKTSQEVIQALNNGKAVLYFVKDGDEGWRTPLIINTYGATVELLYCELYEGNEGVWVRMNHIDNRMVPQ